MKIIFLDVDGVLNCQSTEDHIGRYVGVDEDKVALLKKIIDATGAKIVLSSTWRLGYNRWGENLSGFRERLDEALGKYGLEVYDKTEDLGRHGTCRGQEINKWLEQHPDVEEWVVLDDEYFVDFGYYGITPHHVQTWFYGDGGLHEEDVEQAIQVLNGHLIEIKKEESWDDSE